MADIDNLEIQVTANISQAEQALKKLSTMLEGVSKGLKSVSGATHNLNKSTSKVQSRSKVDSSSFSGDAEKSKTLGDSAGKVKELNNAISKIDTRTWEILSKSLRKVGSLMGSIVKASHKFASMVNPIKAFMRAVEGLRGKLGRLYKSMERIYKMLRLMVMRKILQAVIHYATDGFKNLTHYSSVFDASVSLLWNSMRQLGNSIASMVSPLVNALAPALNTIIQYAINATNAINQLLSALTGAGTWIRAKKLTDSYADSLDKATGSAKKFSKTIRIDELNILKDNGGSGASATDYDDMFETLELAQEWQDLALKLKTMWEDADFTELGLAIGRKLQDALNNIPWDSLTINAEKLASVIATAINGFVLVPSLGNDIGKSLANLLNLGFSALSKFAHTIKWDDCGKFFGNLLNGFFGNIKWGTLYDAMTTFAKGLGTLINNAVDTFDWNNLSTAFTNFCITVADTIAIFMTKTDFHKIGEKIGEQIKKILQNKKMWEKIGRAIADMLDSALGFVRGIIEQLSIKDVVDAIANVFKGFFENFDEGGTLAKVLLFALSASLLKNCVSSIFTSVASKIKDAISKSIGGSIKIMAGISLVVTGIMVSMDAGANLGSGKGGITESILGALSSAGGGALIGSQFGTYGAVAGAVIGLAVSIAIQAVEFQKAYNQSLLNQFYESEVGKELKELKDKLGDTLSDLSSLDIKITSNIETRMNGVNESVKSYDNYLGMLDRLYSLDSKSIKTSVDMQEIELLVDFINQSGIENVRLDLDPDNKNILTLKGYIQDCINLAKQYAMEQALMSAMQENRIDYVDALRIAEETEQKLDEYKQGMSDLVGEYGIDINKITNETITQLENVWRSDYLTAQMKNPLNAVLEEETFNKIAKSIGVPADKLDEFTKKFGELKEPLKQYASDIENATNELKNHNSVIDETEKEYQWYSDKLIYVYGLEEQLKDSIESKGKANEEYVSTIQKVLDKNTVFGKSTEEIDEKQKFLFNTMDNNIHKLIGIKDASEDASSSMDLAKDSSSNLKDAMSFLSDEQQKVVDTLKDSPDALKAYCDGIGLSSEETKKLMDACSNATKELHDTAKAFEDGQSKMKDTSGTDAQIKAFDDVSAKAGAYQATSAKVAYETAQNQIKMKDSVKSSIGSIASAFNEDTTVASAITTFAGKIAFPDDFGDKFNKYGTYATQGLADGIKESEFLATDQIKTLAEELDKNFHDSVLSFGSPSARMKDYGKWTVEGYNGGIGENMKLTKTTIEQWQVIITKAFTVALEEVGNVFSTKLEAVYTTAQTKLEAILTLVQTKVKACLDSIGSVGAELDNLITKLGDTDVKIQAQIKTDIPKYASGGFPERGNLFIANEAGAELVGNINGRTGVASNNEITGIANAVYETGTQEASLLASAVNLLSEIASKDMSVRIGDRDIARASKRGQSSMGRTIISRA